MNSYGNLFYMIYNAFSLEAPLPNYTGTLIKLYRYTYSTIQTYLLNCTGIRMQLYQNLKTTIPRCQHNYINKTG